jgi:hypothetical protein
VNGPFGPVDEKVQLQLSRKNLLTAKTLECNLTMLT